MIFFLKKNWIWVTIGAVVILFLPRLISVAKKVFNIGDTIAGAAGTVASAAADATNKITGTTIKDDQANLLQDFESFRASVKPTAMTKASSFYGEFATQLYNDMQSWTPATFSISEDSFKTLESLNNDDLLQLWKVFGLKENIAFVLWSNGKGDLIFWFKHELEGAWGGKLERMQKIWSKVNWQGKYFW